MIKNDEDSKKDALLGVVSDKYCRDIIKCVMYKPKSIIEIQRETMIPITTIYRRVQILHDLNLLRISGAMNREGKKYFLYKTNVKLIEIKFDDKLEVKVEFV